MSHPILFSVLGALVIMRLIARARMRRRWAGGGGCGGRFAGRCGGPFGGGGPFGRWSRRFGGPIDLGAPERQHYPRNFGRRAHLTVDLANSLELNQRQREIYDEVLAEAKSRLAAPEVAEALGILAREPFDRAALEFLVGQGELADDFEQLHHSLLPEQRAKLRTATGA